MFWGKSLVATFFAKQTNQVRSSLCRALASSYWQFLLCYKSLVRTFEFRTVVSATVDGSPCWTLHRQKAPFWFKLSPAVSTFHPICRRFPHTSLLHPALGCIASCRQECVEPTQLWRSPRVKACSQSPHPAVRAPSQRGQGQGHGSSDLRPVLLCCVLEEACRLPAPLAQADQGGSSL